MQFFLKVAIEYALEKKVKAQRRFHHWNAGLVSPAYNWSLT